MTCPHCTNEVRIAVACAHCKHEIALPLQFAALSPRTRHAAPSLKVLAVIGVAVVVLTFAWNLSAARQACRAGGWDVESARVCGDR
jgi:hypothetical protein